MTIDLGTNLGDDIAAEVAQPLKARRTTKSKDTTRIVLDENDEIPPTGLFVGVNGRGYLIRVGEEVDVPNAVLEVLDHAVLSSAHIDPTTRQVLGHRDRKRFNYTVVKD